MRLARTKNAIKNTIWGLVYKICILIFPFIIRTVLINKLGIEYLGLNSLFASILNMLNLTELGLGSAIVYTMYKPIAENDYITIRALIKLYKKMYMIIGLIVIALGFLIVPYLPYFIKDSVLPDINIYIIFVISLGNSAVTYFIFAYKTCLLNAYQRTDVISKVALFVNIIMYSFQIVVLILFENYYLYLIIQPIAGVITNIINAYFAKKMFPFLYCEGTVEKHTINDIKKRVTGLMISKVANLSRNAFDSLIVSSMIGLTAVAIYNNYYYILSSVSAVLIISMTSISAGVGNSIAIESIEKNEHDFESINFLYMIISFVIFSCFIGLYQPFMTIWVGKDYLFNDKVMLAFSFYFLIDKELNVIGQYYDAAGLWWHGKWIGVIETITNIILNILLCKYYGVLGIIFATIFTLLVIRFPLTVHYLYKFYFKKSPNKFFKKQIEELIVFLFIGCIIYFLTRDIPLGNEFGQSIVNIIKRLTICIGMSLSLAFLYYRDKEIYIQSKKWTISHFYVKAK